MKATHVLTGIVLIGAIAATPAFAQEGRRRRAPNQRQDQGEQNRDQGDRRGGRRTGERAVPREAVRPSEPARRSESARPSPPVRSQESARQGDSRRRDGYAVRRPEPPRRDDDNRYGYGRRGNGRTYYPYYSNRGYGTRTIIVPRYVRPTIVNVIPYRPYHYRPSIGIGIYYGTGGSYPYGYTPRYYYDPTPGRPYGGVRITGASRDAQVFADGYYVGIVDDFDGIFQHVNLEAGPHRIEVVEPGYEAIEFDVMVQPGRTITFRADRYGY